MNWYDIITLDHESHQIMVPSSWIHWETMAAAVLVFPVPGGPSKSGRDNPCCKNWNLRSGPWISRSSFRCAVAMIWRWDSVCQCWPHDQLKVDCTAVIWWTYWHICYSICLLFDIVETDPQNLKKMNESPCFRLQAPSMRIQIPPSQLNTRCRQCKQFQFIKSYRIPRIPRHILAPCRSCRCSGSSSLCSLVDRSKSAKRPVRRQGPVARHKPPLVSDDILPTKNIQKKNSILRREKHVKDVFKHLQSIFSRKWREPHKDCPCC